MDTNNEPLAELPNDNDLMAAAMAVDDAPEAGAKPEGTAAPADPAAPTPNPAATAGDDFDLAALRKIGAERQAQRQQVKPDTAAAPTPDLAQLADHMSGATEMRAAIDAMKVGDATALSKLTGMDEEALYEQWTKRAMKGPDAVTQASELQSLRDKVAELEGKTPEGVMTVERYEAIQADKARDAAYATFREHVSNAENSEEYPLLCKIDGAVATRYGDRAADLLREASMPLTLATISKAAEQLAREELGGLLQAQQVVGRTEEFGERTGAAAISATTGSRRAGGLDNRAAAEAASNLPDFTDEAAFIARAIRAAEAE